MIGQPIQNVKIALNDFFEIANSEAYQKDLNDLLAMAMTSEAFDNLGNIERTNMIFRLLRMQEMIRSVHKFSDWA